MIYIYLLVYICAIFFILKYGFNGKIYYILFNYFETVIHQDLNFNSPLLVIIIFNINILLFALHLINIKFHDLLFNQIFFALFSILLLLLGVGFGIKEKKWNFFKALIPPGVPVIMQPLLLLIEITSTLLKPIILSARFLINVFVSIILYKVFSTMGTLGKILLYIIYIFKFFLGLLQIYMFNLFLMIYLKIIILDH